MKSESKRGRIPKKLKQLKKLKGVNAAMWGYFCLLAFLMIALVELVFSFVVTATFENQARDRVSRIGAELVQEIKVSPGMLNDTVVLYRREGVNILLLSESGEVIVPESTDGIPESILTELQNRIGDAEIGASVTFGSGDTVYFAAKVANGGQTNFAVVMYSIAIVKDTVRNLQWYLLLIGILVLLLALLISYTFSKKLTRGLKTMSDTAVALAKGDYSVQFTNVDYREMAQLSDTLNYVRDEVKKSEDFQREILANVTHDLKTPLTMIKAYASMIKEISGDNPEKRNKHLQVIIDETDRLAGLVNDVLSVSKLSSNLDSVTPKVFNLTELVYGIVNKFGYLQETQGYNLMVDIDANQYTCADEEKISQVIYNLLGNAANYTGADKTVFISLKSSIDGKRIKFSVRDTGKGISKDELPEIWNRYYRVKENHPRPVKGTGLGLNIVKVILENHSFDFGVESEVDKGSVFWVDFPSVPAEIQVEE